MNPAAGRSLAVWLAGQHPELFRAVAQKASRTRRFTHMGALADDLTEFVPTVEPMPVSFDFQPPIQEISFDSSSLAVPDFSYQSEATPLDMGSSGGGFFSSVGSALSSAVSGVGNFLTSQQGLSSLTNLASTYFKAQAQTQTAQTQMAVLQAQTARVANGQTAAPITYTRNPYTGQLQPVIQTANGYQPVSVSSMGVGSVMSQYGLWVAGGLAVLVVLWSMSHRG